MGIEFELKFQATEGVLDAIRQEYPGQGKEYQMETTYYDTPSGSLSARHYTQRRRMENDLSVCTLKTPAGNLGRQELEVSCDSIENALDALCKMGAPQDFSQLTAEGLVAVCGAKFTRLAIPLTLPECTVELALDSGVLTGGGKTQPLCEVEVELKAGSREAVEQFALTLAIKHNLFVQSQSKFRRALALYKGDSL